MRLTEAVELLHTGTLFYRNLHALGDKLVRAGYVLRAMRYDHFWIQRLNLRLEILYERPAVKLSLRCIVGIIIIALISAKDGVLGVPDLRKSRERFIRAGALAIVGDIQHGG